MSIINLFKKFIKKRDNLPSLNNIVQTHDAFYYCLQDGYTSFLRFYTDRTVLYFAAQGNQMEYLEKIAGWLNRDFRHEFLGKGEFTSDGKKIMFDIISLRGTVTYSGLIMKDRALLLTSHSQINGNKQQSKYCPLQEKVGFDWTGKSNKDSSSNVSDDLHFNIKASTTKQLEQLIGKENLTAFDPEFLEDTPTALLGLMDDFLKIAKNELREGSVIANVDCSIFSIKVNGQIHELRPNDRVNYVTSNLYLKDFNVILEANGSKKRFFYYWDDYDFGQDNGYFYADSELGVKLINFLKNPPNLHTDEFGHRLGNRIIKIETEDSANRYNVEYFKKLVKDF